jgi:hypothetical protein
VRIHSRQIEKSECGELPKEWEVGFEMMGKFGEACLWPLEVGKRHHR